MSEQFWLNDLKVLFVNNKYLKIIPNTTMSKIEQINAITRLSFYIIILILISLNYIQH